jgi:Domain of unknown function (DUF5666)
MRKPLIAVSLLVAAVFGVGYLVGQLGGPSVSLAAGGTTKHAAKRVAHKKTTTTKTTSKKAHTNATATTSVAHADGTVTGVSGNAITVKADADPAGSTEYTGVTTIVLSGATKYRAGEGTTTATQPAIAIGEYIVAVGTLNGTTLNATLVSVGMGGPGHGGPGPGGHASGPHADGTVSAVSGDTITVKADADPSGSTEYTGVTTIVLTSTTTYDAGRDATASTAKPTISVGEYIIAEGTLSNGGTILTATQVSVHSGGPGGPGGLGGH